MASTAFVGNAVVYNAVSSLGKQVGNLIKYRCLSGDLTTPFNVPCRVDNLREKTRGHLVLQTFVLPVGATCLAHPQQIGEGGQPASPTAAVGTLRASWGPPFISASSLLLHPGVCVSPLPWPVVGLQRLELGVVAAVAVPVAPLRRRRRQLRQGLHGGGPLGGFGAAKTRQGQGTARRQPPLADWRLGAARRFCNDGLRELKTGGIHSSKRLGVDGFAADRRCCVIAGEPSALGRLETAVKGVSRTQWGEGGAPHC